MLARHAPVTPRVGIAVTGVGGAVATTVAAGLELLRLGLTDTGGLPLAHVDEQLVPYTSMTIAGWDICPDDLTIWRPRVRAMAFSDPTSSRPPARR